MSGEQSIVKATADAPEQIWLGKHFDDKSWEWHGSWNMRPFNGGMQIEQQVYVRQDIADARAQKVWDEAIKVAKKSCKRTHGKTFDNTSGLMVVEALEAARAAGKGGE